MLVMAALEPDLVIELIELNLIYTIHQKKKKKKLYGI